MKQETFSLPPDGDRDQGWAILAVCWAFIACALISTILRVCVRSRITHNVGGDDYVAVAAMVRARSSALGLQSLTGQSGIDDILDRRWINNGRGPEWTWKTRVLFDCCTEATLPGSGLGRLDTDLHYSRAHENIHLFVSSPNRGHQAGSPRHVRSGLKHCSLHRSFRLLVPRGLPTSSSVLGCGRRWSVSLEASGGIHRPRARQ